MKTTTKIMIGILIVLGLLTFLLPTILFKAV